MFEYLWLVYLILIVALLLTLLRVGKLAANEEVAPERTCPVCGSTLAQGESLYADEIRKSEDESELRIKGCPRCYEDKNSLE